MAHSKRSALRLGIPQHFLVCDNCKRNCEFYCNPCHKQLCQECKDQHLKMSKDHEVVLYQQRKRKLPVEKCKAHPTKDIDMLCVDCQLPLCSKCSTQGDHRRHELADLETIYGEKMAICLQKISEVHEYFLPTSQDLKNEIKGDVMKIKMITNRLKTAMKTDGESLKSMVDTVVSENMQEVDKIEHSLLKKIESQDATFDDYISYLHGLVKKFHGHLSSKKLTIMIPKLSENFQEVRPIPDTTKLVTPVFTAGQYSKDDVAKLLGKIVTKNKTTKVRKIKPMKIVSSSTSVDSTRKQKKQGKDKESDVKQTMSLSSFVTEVRKFRVQGVSNASHISFDKSGRLCVSDIKGNLVQTDLQGNQLQKIQTSVGDEGYHTVAQNGDLIFTDRKNNVINEVALGNKIKTVIGTGAWTPISIHSSHINWDILVGMRKDGEAKVSRFSKTGKELQNIQRDDKGWGLYSDPHYITENINGDICVSDENNQALVVVNKSGQHRFSYRGQEYGGFMGISTDALGHILVCSFVNIHLLDQNGHFLSLLLTDQQDICYPRSVCIDDENNLYVGQDYTNTLTVYKYRQ